MAVQKRLVNRQQGRRPRKPNGKRGKVALQAGVHFKTPGGVVHATHKLGTFNGAAGDFGQVEPMGIVQMLTDQGNGALGVVFVHFGQIQIVQKINNSCFNGVVSVVIVVIVVIVNW